MIENRTDRRIESGCIGVSLFPHCKNRIEDIREKALPKSISFLIKKETPRCACAFGVLTLEAAVILPILASFFVSILFFFRVMQVQIEVQKALDDTGRKLAVCLAIEDEEGKTADYAIAETMLLKELRGRDEIEHYVTGGIWGISLSGSHLSGDEVILKASYQMELPVKLFWNWRIRKVQRAECRKWTGWKPAGENGSEDIWVYVTETGTVYHRRRDCTHLRLSIQSVAYAGISEYRNENGERYHACALCGQERNESGRVYITNQGNCYHNDLSCSGIKRTVYMIRFSEVGSRRACSQCGAY